MLFTSPWPVFGHGNAGDPLRLPLTGQQIRIPPVMPLGLGGHHCATSDDLWAALTYRVSTDLTWGTRSEQPHMDIGPMLSALFAGDPPGNGGTTNPREW